MTPKRFWGLALVVLAASICLGQFGGATWKRHSANSVMIYNEDHRYLVLPTCPDDRTTVEFGSACKDPATGKNYIRGPWEVIQ